jgi:hypothetical protein
LECPHPRVFGSTTRFCKDFDASHHVSIIGKEKNSMLFKIAWPFWKRYGSYSVLIARYFSK